MRYRINILSKVITVLSCMIAFFVIASGFKVKTGNGVERSDKKITPPGISEIVDNPGQTSSTSVKNKNVREITFKKTSESDGNILIKYPELIGENFDKINKLIKYTALKYVVWQEENAGINNTLDITGEITFMDSKYISIVFKGLINITTYAYPTNAFYTLTIDIPNNKVVTLAEQFRIDDSFVSLVRQKLTEQIRLKYEADQVQDVENWLNSTYDDNRLKEALNSADSDGQTGICSFLTNDSLGISIPILHVLGDHLEAYINYGEIKSNLK